MNILMLKPLHLYRVFCSSCKSMPSLAFDDQANKAAIIPGHENTVKSTGTPIAATGVPMQQWS